MGWISGPCEPDDHEEMVVLDEAAMTPDEEREQASQPVRMSGKRVRMIWVDSGSGPGYEAFPPKLRPDRDKLS